MHKLLLASLLLFSATVSAKNLREKTNDIRYREGLLQRISCRFTGAVRTSTGPAITSIDFPDPALTVCDPFTNLPGASPDNGLLGSLILKTPEMGSNVSSVMDYYNKGQRLEQKLYFADVNVPTRPFTEGFSTQDGGVLVDAQGEKLIEHFAVEYTSNLKLGPNEKPGHYRLGVLSDDGARVFVKENGAWREVINNDGIHPTRMGCSNSTVHLTKDSEIPLKILYYQGPRYHIANVLMWKRHHKARQWRDSSRHSFCGVASNHFFTSISSKHSKKKITPMNILEKQGWRILANQNYKMPAQQQNPCVTEELTLTDFQLVSLVPPKATVTWKTNLPATSQLRIINAFTGEEVLTNLDSNLVTEHTAEINGLVSRVIYRVQAISKDAEGREVTSDSLLLRP